MRRVIAFLTNLFFKPAAVVPESMSDYTPIDPLQLPSFHGTPEPAEAPPVKKVDEEPKKNPTKLATAGPMKLKSGECKNWTNRGFYRGYHGPVVRV
ncbi:MAG TPA: hypothetical protein VJI70_00215 [Candidatus Paceibacterota bacterium]